jgi:hypothetical protein
MANAVQATAKKLFLDGDIDLLTDTIKVTLVDLADYTYSSAHDFIADVPLAARVATATLASKTTTGGVFDAADATFTSATGDQSEALVIWKDTGTESTSPFICYFDSATGLPVTPSGIDISIIWDNGANKIFAL